jgi:hypothetical protein
MSDRDWYASWRRRTHAAYELYNTASLVDDRGFIELYNKLVHELQFCPEVIIRPSVTALHNGRHDILLKISVYDPDDPAMNLPDGTIRFRDLYFGKVTRGAKKIMGIMQTLFDEAAMHKPRKRLPPLPSPPVERTRAIDLSCGK